MTIAEERAIACARLAGAYSDLLNAALTHLELHYAARITGLMLCRGGDQRAAIGALQREREAACADLRHRLLQEKRRAIDGITKQTRRRYHVAASPEVLPDRAHRPTVFRRPTGATTSRPHSSP